MNTYWDASRWTFSASRSDPYARLSINQTTGLPYEYLTLNQTDAPTTRQVPIYKASIPWILTLLLCSGVLLLLGIANVVVVLQTTAPDILGYVSSLTRDNPHVEIPKGGTTLYGKDRARLVRDIKIQLADVKEGGEVGYIALKSSGGGAAGAGRLRSDRLYT